VRLVALVRLAFKASKELLVLTVQPAHKAFRELLVSMEQLVL
jgi:hypothetical protein